MGTPWKNGCAGGPPPAPANLRRGISPWTGKPYSFAWPSTQTYPYQWFWDSCFHAIVWTHLDMEQAKEELRTLLRAQRVDGHIPHRIAWERTATYPYRFYLHSRSMRHPWRSELVQPPVLAIAVEEVHARSGDDAFLAEVLPGVAKFYRWLADQRDPDGDDLISIIHPYESGIDHKPAYDVVYGLKGSRPTPEIRLRMTRSRTWVSDSEPACFKAISR
jgi:glycogen debranching enzyme